tara:strand:- start:1243 stop:1347 length:105 start_codon:yes stop_codon:yes gene_type:complete
MSGFGWFKMASSLDSAGTFFISNVDSINGSLLDE